MKILKFGKFYENFNNFMKILKFGKFYETFKILIIL